MTISRTLPVPTRYSSAWVRAAAVAFLLALTQFPEVKSLGTLYLHDFVSPALLVILLLTTRDLSPLRAIRLPLLLGAVWLLGAVATDMIVGSLSQDYLRGWFRIVLLLGNIVTIWLLSRGDIRVLSAYMFGSGIVLLMRTALVPSEFALEDPWKFGYGTALFLLAGSMSGWPQIRDRMGAYTPSIILGVLGVISLTRNSRSAFVVGVLAAGYSAMTVWISGRPALARRVTPSAFVGVLLAGMMAIYFLSGLYGNAAANGYLGEAAQRKYIEQTMGDTSLILGGRPELFVSTVAIKDSPIVGHGSWARDRYYSLLFWYELRSRGLSISDQYGVYSSGSNDLIPSHSHLLGSWVEAGVLSVPFWIWVIILVFQALFSAVRINTVPSALVSIIGMITLWDVLFSPFAADARIFKAASICVLLSAVISLRHRRMASPARLSSGLLMQ